MNLINVAKIAIYGIFINYYCYYILQGSFIPYGTILFYALAFMCVILDAYKSNRMSRKTEIMYWIFYGVVSLALVSFAQSSSHVFSGLYKYAQRTALIVFIYYICSKESSIRFAINLLMTTAVSCAISILMTIDNITSRLSLSTGADVSANDVGAILAFGCFAILQVNLEKIRSSTIRNLLKVSGIILCITVIFLTGSRKSIYAVILLWLLLFIMGVNDYWKNISPATFFSLTAVLILASVWISDNLVPYMYETSLYNRLFGVDVDITVASDDGRMELYALALKDFWKKPIIGMGFNNFDFLHGTYSHSTYVEPLANSGLLGLLYLIPYVEIVKKQIRLVRAYRYSSQNKLQQKEILSFLIVFLFIGIGIPYIYKDYACIILAMFLANQTIAFRENRYNGE